MGTGKIVAKTFDSIQGEGPFMGTKATFIRLAGCNLSCPWCDTKDQVYETLDLETLIGRIKWPNVIITGGEPTVIPSRLATILSSIRDLPERYYTIHLETNGTATQVFDIDVVSISPKLGIHEYDDNEIDTMQKQIDHCRQGGTSEAFFKFVVGDPTSEMPPICDFIEGHGFEDVLAYISPLADVPFNREAYLGRINAVTQSIMELPSPNFRLTIQLHKLADVE